MAFDDLADVVDQEDGAAGGIGAAAEPSAGMGATGAFGGLEGGFGRGVGDLPNQHLAGLTGYSGELQGAIANIGPDIVRDRCVGRRCGRETRRHKGWPYGSVTMSLWEASQKATTDLMRSTMTAA